MRVRLPVLALSPLLLVACTDERLLAINERLADDDVTGGPVGGPGPVDDPENDPNDPSDPSDPSDPNEPNDPADPSDPDPSDPLPPVEPGEPIACLDGGETVSWEDTLPGAPAALVPAALLGPSSGAPEGTCTGTNTVVTDVSTTETISSGLAHVGGRYYFEATVLTFEAGWSQIGVFAEPAGPFDLTFGAASAAGVSLNGPSTIGVAVDLDAGAAFFYEDGVRSSTASLDILPGIGAYHAGGVSMIGNEIRFNFGASPFEHAVPDGYSAWNSGDETAAGACISDDAAPAPEANVTGLCAAPLDECTVTSFLTPAEADTDLVILGTYDNGAVGSWEWQDVTGNGDYQPVVVREGVPGQANVHVDRPGRVALVLSTYEPSGWTVTAGPDTELVSVSAYAMHPQTVSAPAGVPVDVHTICTDGDGGYCQGSTGENFPIAPHQWPFDTGGGDTQGFVRLMESRFCLPMKIFGGAYEASGFTVN